MSATCMPQGDLPIPNIVHRPALLGSSSGGRAQLRHRRPRGWLETKILEVGADKVAAFIGEPVQGAAA